MLLGSKEIVASSDSETSGRRIPKALLGTGRSGHSQVQSDLRAFRSRKGGAGQSPPRTLPEEVGRVWPGGTTPPTSIRSVSLNVSTAGGPSIGRH